MILSRCITDFMLTFFPGAPARVCRGFSSSSLPTGEPHQAAAGVQPGTGAAVRCPKHSIPAKPSPGGEGRGQHAPEQPLHLCTRAGHPAGGGQAGEETKRDVWVLILPPGVQEWVNCVFTAEAVLLQTDFWCLYCRTTELLYPLIAHWLVSFHSILVFFNCWLQGTEDCCCFLFRKKILQQWCPR